MYLLKNFLDCPQNIINRQSLIVVKFSLTASDAL